MTVELEKSSKITPCEKRSFPRCFRLAELPQGLVDGNGDSGRKVKRTHAIRPDGNADNPIGMAFEKRIRQAVCFRSENEGVPRSIND
jgi:hypothetical protein